jgi:hypothetical protein
MANEVQGTKTKELTGATENQTFRYNVGGGEPKMQIPGRMTGTCPK